MNSQLFDQMTEVMQEADCIHDATAVDNALHEMAKAITADIGNKVPLVIGVMNGGMLPLSLLLTKLNFPLKLDYLHATRYRENTVGTELMWQRSPAQPLTGQHVLIVDDILDEGHTLAAIIEYCQAQNPASIKTAVLAQKMHDRGVRPQLDYIGLEVPDRYVFGCGMDYKGYWRNSQEIYAIKEVS